METLGLPFSWMGTKVKMRGVLLPIIDSIPRALYVEPFGGAGGLFFGKKPERAEVFNDSNELIINAFRTLRNSETREQVLMLLDATPMSRSVYYELKPIMRKYFVGEDYQLEKKRARLDEYSNEVAIAYAFLYIQNVGFRGAGFNRAFGGGSKGKDAGSVMSAYSGNRRRLCRYVERLEQVSIECLDAFECIAKYDHSQTLFFVDPPYRCKSSVSYRLPWSEECEEKLVETLVKLKGSYVLTVYDNEIYRRLLDCGATRNEFAKKSLMTTIREKMSERVETIYYKSVNGYLNKDISIFNYEDGKKEESEKSERDS